MSLAVKVRRKRQHKGDIMSVDKRSALMSRIKGRDTGPSDLLHTPFFSLGCPGKPIRGIYRAVRILCSVSSAWPFLSMVTFGMVGDFQRGATNCRSLGRQSWPPIAPVTNAIDRNCGVQAGA